MKKLLAFTLFICIAWTSLLAQDSEENIDPSKPTNIYTRINNNFEFTDRSGEQEYGYRFNYNYATSDIQFTAEVPYLYNASSKQYGLSDIRLRTFYVPYVNYDKTFAGLGLSMDLFLPTGSVEDKLGSGSWSISPGILAGILVNDSYSIWPNISYRYQVASVKDDIISQHGMTVQITNSINISPKIYLNVSPMVLLNDFKDENRDLLGGEFEFNYMIKKNKLQIGFFSRQLFNHESYTQSYRLMARIFL